MKVLTLVAIEWYVLYGNYNHKIILKLKPSCVSVLTKIHNHTWDFEVEYQVLKKN